MAITTHFKNYATAHGKGEGGGGGGTTIIMGNINNNDLPNDINVGSITAENGNIDYLNGKSLSYNDGGFIYISANDGTIAKLRGDEISYKDGVISRLKSDEITTGKLKADEAEIDKATINTINSKNITTEYLTVTKQAHFFELIVDKIRSVGGTTIQTAANCIIDWVKAYDSSDNEVALDANNVAYYNVYWRATESSGRQITNDWLPFDQAICQSFNNVTAGVNYDISNKYYWRLVTALLPDTYMNINTGATTTQANAGVNSVQITNRTITYKDYQDQDQTLVNKFDIVAQTIPNVQTGASWNSSTETMTTTNTVFGIQLTPQQDLDNIVPTKFSFDCSSARLSVGIYYVDSTSQYFPAPDNIFNHYEFDLNADNNIEAIIITNADEVQWHLVHGIKLSNTDKDANLSGSSSIPSKGDNIAQLGYRWNANGADANDKKRASAIIIAAYQTPDTGLTPPSYAQYQNITDYSLSSHRGTYMDANGSKFIGDFYIDSNTSIEDYIDEHVPEYNMYTAYANSADGTVDFTTDQSYASSRSYMGICSSPANTAPQTPASYSWFLIQGAVGPTGPQGPTGPSGPQGSIGPNGADAKQYVLIDQGSKAYVHSSLDNSNQIVQQMYISLKYKVAKIEGTSATIMSYNDLLNFNNGNNTIGMYAYSRFSTVASDNTDPYYVYWRSTLSNDNGEGYYTWTGPWNTPSLTSPKIINDNPVITTALLSYNAGLDNQGRTNTIADGNQVDYTRDTQTISVTLESSATLQILQGQNASISTLVTGQQGQQQEISQLQQTAGQLSSTVTRHSDEIDDINDSISEIRQTADEIELKVKNTGVNIDDETITLSANNTIINGQLTLKQSPTGAQGLIFKNASNQEGLKISTDEIPSLQNFISGYQGYPHLDLGTNGYGFQSSNRYLYVTNDNIALYSDAVYGKNNEGLLNTRIPQSGGPTGEIIDYIGDTNQSDTLTHHADPNITANVSFVESNIKLQHNGVRCIRIPVNPSSTSYTFKPSSKDKVLLCYPQNGRQITIDVGIAGVTGNGTNVGHIYYLKIMPTASANVKVVLTGATFLHGDRDIEDTLPTSLTITDNCLYTIIILGQTDGSNRPQYALVGKMQSGSYA